MNDRPTAPLVSVRDHGACGDGNASDTRAFAEAVAFVAARGGGTVLVPAGAYVVGAVTLASNVNLHLDAGATLLASQDPADFPLERLSWEGREELGHRAVIGACDAENVSVSGHGAIDGRGAPWWQALRARTLVHRRPRLLHFVRCRRVRIEGIALLNSPAWTVHPIECVDVVIDGITIRNPADSPNTDGINPESCRQVRISNCYVDSGDDCITIKAGRAVNGTPHMPPCEDVAITNCTLVHGHGGIVIGSEMSGGVRNIVAANCVLRGTDRGIRIKTNRSRGGVVENVLVSNMVMENVAVPLSINMYYKFTLEPELVSAAGDRNARPVDAGTPRVRNIRLHQVVAREAAGRIAVFAHGLPESPVEGLCLSDVDIAMTQEENPRRQRPDMIIGDPLYDPCGMYAVHVDGLRLRNVRIRHRAGEMIRTESVRNAVVTD